MNSGIYRLTFSSGYFYVGKSINIPTRWQQHELKFRTHKAAKRMQEEFDRCGSPKKEVLVYCHIDHIDIVETWLIATNYRDRGEFMLNATYPEPLPDSEYLKINRDPQLLLQSTPDHIETICDLRSELCEQEIKLTQQRDFYQQKFEKLASTGVQLPEDLQQIAEENSELREQVDCYLDEYIDAKTELNSLKEKLAETEKAFQEYKSLPWYRKLFW